MFRFVSHDMFSNNDWAIVDFAVDRCRGSFDAQLDSSLSASDCRPPPE